MPANNRYRKILRFIPMVLWMSVIFILSSRTGDEVNTALPFFQSLMPWITDFNWGHYVAYFILALTIDYAIGARAERIVWKVAIVIICGLYGVSDEWHQSFVGGRMMDIMDVRNDMIGAACFVLLVAVPPIKKAWSKLKKE